MAQIDETIWPLEAHTKAKHEILQRYLGAWFPILGTTNHRILYIDGFCGPGRYADGEPGSPIIAITQAISLIDKLTKTELTFIFIDERCDRLDYLNAEIAKINLPPNFHVHTLNTQFDISLSSILNEVGKQEKILVPTFAFIDPFGWSEIPFDVVSRLLDNQQTEVFINFPINSINRFIEHPNLKDRKHIRDLFGVTEDRILDASQALNRIDRLKDLYQMQLKKHAKFVRYFEMRDERNNIIYYLFFASNHRLGHIRMKEAFWKVDQQSGYKFSDRTNPNQLVLLEIDPSDTLAAFLKDHYSGRVVLSETVISFVEDETPYITKHARSALRKLEIKELINIDKQKRDGSKRIKGFPPGVIIHF
jgi:three-Cys-motif partner protein